MLDSVFKKERLVQGKDERIVMMEPFICGCYISTLSIVGGNMMPRDMFTKLASGKMVSLRLQAAHEDSSNNSPEFLTFPRHVQGHVSQVLQVRSEQGH